MNYADEDPSLGVASTTLPDSVGPDPHRRAMYALHVGARPGSLPCRDNELVRVLGDVADLVTSGVGGCICGYLVALFCPLRLH